MNRQPQSTVEALNASLTAHKGLIATLNLRVAHAEQMATQALNVAIPEDQRGVVLAQLLAEQVNQRSAHVALQLTHIMTAFDMLLHANHLVVNTEGSKYDKQYAEDPTQCDPHANYLKLRQQVNHIVTSLRSDIATAHELVSPNAGANQQENQM